MEKPNPANHVPGVLALISTVKWMSLLPVVYGAIYTIDCRFYSTTMDLKTCYFQGATLIGIGGTLRGNAHMFMAGYNTENPSITRTLHAKKREEDQAPPEGRRSDPT